MARRKLIYVIKNIWALYFKQHASKHVKVMYQKKTLALPFYTTIPTITSKIGFLLTYVLYESFYPN